MRIVQVTVDPPVDVDGPFGYMIEFDDDMTKQRLQYEFEKLLSTLNAEIIERI
jgi:hypothetical protein